MSSIPSVQSVPIKVHQACCSYLVVKYRPLLCKTGIGKPFESSGCSCRQHMQFTMNATPNHHWMVEASKKERKKNTRKTVKSECNASNLLHTTTTYGKNYISNTNYNNSTRRRYVETKVVALCISSGVVFVCMVFFVRSYPFLLNVKGRVTFRTYSYDGTLLDLIGWRRSTGKATEYVWFRVGLFLSEIRNLDKLVHYYRPTPTT